MGNTPAAPKPSETSTVAAASNGKTSTAPASIPKPKDGTDVDVDVRLRYEADAKDITQTATTTPKLSQEQAAEIARRSQSARGRRVTELDEWLDYWREFGEVYGDESNTTDVTKFKISVVREADTLLPGMPPPYAVPCTEERNLMRWPFHTDVNKFTQQLQAINGNSGGRFRVSLIDGDGDFIRKEWIDNRGNPLEGHQNASWSGSIPNPVGTQTQKPESKQNQNKEKSRLELLREMAEERALQIQLGIIKENDSNDDSLLKELRAGVIPTFVASLIGVTTEVTKTALENSSSKEDKGFWGNLLNSERVQNRALDGIDTAIAFGASLAGEFFKGRHERQRERAEMEKLEFLSKNPQLANTVLSQSQNQNTQPQEDAFDYVMRKCEEKDLSFNIVTDERFAQLGMTERTVIRGVLASDLAPDEVLSKFVSLCNMKGKGERARKLADENLNPHTLQFIERQQRFVKESQG